MQSWMVCIQSGVTVSSPSTKQMYSARARSSAALRAATTPLLGWWMTCTRLSLAAYSSHMTPHSSGEPSSTRMSSKLP